MGSPVFGRDGEAGSADRPVFDVLRWASNRSSSLAAAAFVFVVYAPLAGRRSAWSDDFPRLLDKDSLITDSVDDGRPVLGLVNRLVLGSADTIGDLAVPRLLGVIGIAALIGYLAAELRKLDWSASSATLIACSIALLPPFHGYAGWATLFSYPWFILLGAWSGSLWVEAVHLRSWMRAALGFGCFLIAMLAYPPAAMFCWAVLGIRHASRPVALPSMFREALAMGCLVVGSGVVAIGVGKVVMGALDVEPTRLGVVESLPELVEKMVWFLTHPVVVAARPFVILSPGEVVAVLTAGPVLALILVGLSISRSGAPGNRLAAVGLLLTVSALTMTAHLVSVDNQIEYRFMAGIVVLTWVYIVVAVRAVYRRLMAERTAGRWVGAVGVPVLLVVVTVATWMAWTNVHQVFVGPAEVKEEYLVDHLGEFDPDQHDRIVVLQPADGWPSRSNLGIFSSRTDLGHDWVVEPNVRLLLAERFGRTEGPEVLVTYEPTELGPRDFGLDLRPLRNRL